jgi:hypothetical protein
MYDINEAMKLVDQMDAIGDSPDTRAVISKIVSQTKTSDINKLLPHVRVIVRMKPDSFSATHLLRVLEDTVMDRNLIKLAKKLDVPDDIIAPLRAIAAGK